MLICIIKAFIFCTPMMNINIIYEKYIMLMWNARIKIKLLIHKTLYALVILNIHEGTENFQREYAVISIFQFLLGIFFRRLIVVAWASSCIEFDFFVESVGKYDRLMTWIKSILARQSEKIKMNVWRTMMLLVSCKGKRACASEHCLPLTFLYRDAKINCRIYVRTETPNQAKE
jgi:hypothetical protein